MPLSYSLTGIRNTVIPKAFIIPAAVRAGKLFHGMVLSAAAAFLKNMCCSFRTSRCNMPAD